MDSTYIPSPFPTPHVHPRELCSELLSNIQNYRLRNPSQSLPMDLIDQTIDLINSIGYSNMNRDDNFDVSRQLPKLIEFLIQQAILNKIDNKYTVLTILTKLAPILRKYSLNLNIFQQIGLGGFDLEELEQILQYDQDVIQYEQSKDQNGLGQTLKNTNDNDTNSDYDDADDKYVYD